MSQSNSNKQSVLIGALSGALIVALAAAGFLYMQNKPSEPISVQPAVVAEVKPILIQPPSLTTALKDLFGSTDPSGNIRPDSESDAKKITSPWFGQSFKIGDASYHELIS